MGLGRRMWAVVGAAVWGAAVAAWGAEGPTVRREGEAFHLATSRVQRTVEVRDGKVLLTRWKDVETGRELLPGGAGVEEFSLVVGGDRALGGASGGWKLIEAKESVPAAGQVRLDLTVEREGGLRVTRHYVLYAHTSVVREASTIRNAGARPVRVGSPSFLRVAARVGELEGTDFHWMTGAHNLPGLWSVKAEKLAGGKVRGFDSYDPYPHVPGSARGFKPGTASYAPWYALFAADKSQGVVIGFDYFGHWASAFEAEGDGTVAATLRVAGFERELAPGASIQTPWAFTALFHRDLDHAGNVVLDWQYEHLWDHTRDGSDGRFAWFPALRHLGYWAKGTGWQRPGVGWTGGDPDVRSLERKLLRVADFMRQTGCDVYHRDWGWWDVAGDWNGPDFRMTGQYLRKHDMGQLIYAFLYTVSRKSRVAREHPEWLARGDDDGFTLDLSRPEVVAFIQGQLDEFVRRWGSFTWRNDSTITGQRDEDPSTLLEQDRNFRGILRWFLEKYPDCAFQAVNGGGNFAGYDYARYASNVQFSDGAIGALRNQWASLLLPPDKTCDNPDQWNPDRYDKATWRGLLTFNYDTTGDTIDPEKVEGIRLLNDIYHYLLKQGVVGRWVRVHRPVVEGDDATMWFQRVSRDGKRSIIIPKRVPKGAVTVWPKGLVSEESYVVSYQESEASERRTGADLMARGIRLERMAAGELIYLNLPLHPGNKIDKTRPAPPRPVGVRVAENLGYPGVELRWEAGVDDHWVSYHEVFRDGRPLEKVARGTYLFDHSAGADARVLYEVRAVDGAGNASEKVAFPISAGRPATVIDDADPRVRYEGEWKELREPPAHGGTVRVAGRKGAAAEVEVEGKAVLLYVRHAADAGKVAVRIDGGEARVADTFSADDIWGACVMRVELPTAGRHRVRVEVAGERSGRGTGERVYLDAVRVE